jgi:uncharacterized protein (TIGR03435 family)
MLLTVKHTARIAFSAWLAAAELSAQSEAANGDRLEFDVTSVKQNKSGDPTSKAVFPLGPGTVYSSNGGHFSATNYSLYTYILFAYKIMGNEEQAFRSQMPDWVLTDRFDIQARTDGDPAKDTKDQMRLMMRALLADRFKLALHTETHQAPVFALVPLKAGKSGPKFQAHPDGSCATDPPPPPTQIAGEFPALCGGLLAMPESAPGLYRFGARNVTMPFLANQLAGMGTLDRPVLDRTGFEGTFDFALEWAPETGPQPPGAGLQPDLPGPTFLEAVKEQLGLKLESQKGPVDVLILDHVERPSGN